MPLIERCVCDGRIFRVVEAFGLPMRECRKCYTLHQHVEMDAAGLSRWYAEEYHAGIYSHSYAHDRAVAELRVVAYGDRLAGRVLDIGCGNGAFVDACREAGIEAEGQDIGGGSAVHRVPLEEVTGVFRTVTLHDVLEHSLDPAQMIDEAARLLDRRGTLIVDFPDFFGEDGARHWKPVEHLWMLSRNQVERILLDADFRIDDCRRPVPGKLVFYAHP